MSKFKTGMPDGDNKVTIGSVEIEYLQESDGLAENLNDVEVLKINTEDATNGIYFAIKTERWTFDNIQDLIYILEDFKQKAGV